MTLVGLTLILTLIFGVLGLIHIYWAFGGKWGFEMSLPTKENGERFMNPGPISSLIVGIGLLFFGCYYYLYSGLINIAIPHWIHAYVGWIIPGIFIIRAVGDFNYVGFFKKIRNTEFGKTDSKLFSPLCLFIGTLGLIIHYLK